MEGMSGCVERVCVGQVRMCGKGLCGGMRRCAEGRIVDRMSTDMAFTGALPYCSNVRILGMIICFYTAFYNFYLALFPPR